jgi:syntaxin-binding protein 1
VSALVRACSWRSLTPPSPRRYTFQNESGKIEDKEATLTDEDKVWTEVRHMHMKDALDKLIADFKAYAGEHGGKFGGEG